MENLRSAKIAVVGAGAVGSYYGGLLARMGHNVHFLLRSDFEAVRRDGLTIRTGGEELRFPVNSHVSPEEIGPCDWVIIALKATANNALDRLLTPLIGPQTRLLTLQNGLGQEDLLAARWGQERICGGLCFVCLNRVAPGVIEHYDHGTLSLGEWDRKPSKALASLADGFRSAGIETMVVEDLRTERWRKLVWNIPFNGLSIAAGGIPVSEILADVGLRHLARALMSEVCAAASALGHELPEEFANYQLERTWSMGPYKPSSLIDWQLHRPVEVEVIWGEPLRRGQQAGATMPRLEMLYHLLRSLTRLPEEKA